MSKYRRQRWLGQSAAVSPTRRHQSTPALASSPGCHFKDWLVFFKRHFRSSLPLRFSELVLVVHASLTPVATVSMTKLISAALLPTLLVNHSTQHQLEFMWSIFQRWRRQGNKHYDLKRCRADKCVLAQHQCIMRHKCKNKIKNKCQNATTNHLKKRAKQKVSRIRA